MPDKQKGTITINNPDHPETDFRQNNQGRTNRVGTINYGNGVNAKLGLLRGSGQEAVYIYSFDDDKYDEESAQEWLDSHRSEKAMTKPDFVNKKFKFNMPLIKHYTDEEDGFLYLEYALATTDVDLEGEQVTDKFLKSMLEQSTSINMYLDHKYGLEHTIGPVVKGEIIGNQLWIKGRVRKQQEPTIRDVLESETRMGGSFGGICTKDYMDKGIRKLDEGMLLDATFTPMPVNTATSGTARGVEKECTVCNQIFKSIESKYGIKKEAGMEDNNVTRTEDESYEALTSKVRAAIRNKFTNTFDGMSEFWVKLTFPDSVIVESFKDDKLYEITYNINDAGEVEVGEPVEVMEQYVEKKLEVFKTKAIKHELPADYKTKVKTNGDDSMDEKDVQKMIKESNDELLDKIKGLIQPKEDPEVDETPAIDVGEITKQATDNVTKNLLKALGVEEEEEESPSKDELSKAFGDFFSDGIKKAVLEIAKNREGTRKSKSLGLPKFKDIVEEEETADKTKGGQMSTKDAALAVAKKKGLA